MPAAVQTRWILAAVVLVAATIAVIATPFFGAEPLDRVEVRQVPHQTVSSAPALAPAQTATPAVDIAWSVPEGWSETPTKQMRLANFAIAGGGEAGVFLFPGGGDTLANVNRWRGQAGLAPLDAAGLAKALTTGTCTFGPYSWLTLSGPTKAFLAAIIPTPGGQCFIKLEAPAERLDGLRDSFLAFTNSLHPAGQKP